MSIYFKSKADLMGSNTRIGITKKTMSFFVYLHPTERVNSVQYIIKHCYMLY
jgi:hypothetical protein